MTDLTTVSDPAPVQPRSGAHSTLTPLGLGAVRITGGAWAERQRINRETTIPHVYSWLEREGSIDNLRRLDPAAEGEPARRGFLFTDSDLYKAMEGVAWDRALVDTERLAKLDHDVSHIVSRAQAQDGYLNSYVQADLAERWAEMAMGHELYCLGHLVQAAIAQKRATGDDTLLDVAIAAADNAVAEFGDGRRGDNDGHEEVEMALVELYRETGTRAYLDLAQQFVDRRGHHSIPFGPNSWFDPGYYQDGIPVRDQTEVVGHAVRALYLLSGVVDIYLETGEVALLDAAVAQWKSMTATKTYLNAALASRMHGEAFGDAYELPPDLVYGETCATIANIMLSWRLLLATGEAVYADAIERALYNVFSSATSVAGDSFFYSNPAHRRVPGAHAHSEADKYAPVLGVGTRPQWYACACCPPNIVRTVATLGAYAATTDATGLQVHQYFAADVAGAGFVLAIETDYPNSGRIAVRVLEAPTGSATLSLRIPAWASGVTVSVNGTAGDTDAPDGYLRLARDWSDGDAVLLDIPLVPRLTMLHPSVDATRGAVAVERGPVVYAVESVDQPDVDLEHLDLLVDLPLAEEETVLLGTSLVLVRATGRLRDDSSWGGVSWRPYSASPPTPGREVALTFIPYALWANRGPSTMRIFLPASNAR